MMPGAGERFGAQKSAAPSTPSGSSKQPRPSLPFRGDQEAGGRVSQGAA